MNVRIVLKVLGLFTAAIALSMTAALVWALIDGTGDRMPLVWGILAGTGIGLAMWIPNRNEKAEIHLREGFAIVSLSWALAAFAGAIPFFLYSHTYGGPGFDSFQPQSRIVEFSTRKEAPSSTLNQYP